MPVSIQQGIQPLTMDLYKVIHDSLQTGLDEDSKCINRLTRLLLPSTQNTVEAGRTCHLLVSACKPCRSARQVCTATCWVWFQDPCPFLSKWDLLGCVAVSTIQVVLDPSLSVWACERMGTDISKQAGLQLAFLTQLSWACHQCSLGAQTPILRCELAFCSRST